MAHFFNEDDGISPYLKARRKFMTEDAWQNLITDLSNSSTLYIGNLSFHTTEEQIYEFFSHIGIVKRVIMGLNRIEKTPCGFCFVEYYNHNDAWKAKLYLNGMKLDERIIRADLDPGFTEGRQFGRSKTGGQVRDIHREDYDPGRGGIGEKFLNQNKRQRYGNYDRGRYNKRRFRPRYNKRYFDEQDEERSYKKFRNEEENPRFIEKEDEN